MGNVLTPSMRRRLGRMSPVASGNRCRARRLFPAFLLGSAVVIAVGSQASAVPPPPTVPPAPVLANLGQAGFPVAGSSSVEPVEIGAGCEQHAGFCPAASAGPGSPVLRAAGGDSLSLTAAVPLSGAAAQLVTRSGASLTLTAVPSGSGWRLLLPRNRAASDAPSQILVVLNTPAGLSEFAALLAEPRRVTASRRCSETFDGRAPTLTCSALPRAKRLSSRQRFRLLAPKRAGAYGVRLLIHTPRKGKLSVRLSTAGQVEGTARASVAAGTHSFLVPVYPDQAIRGPLRVRVTYSAGGHRLASVSRTVS